MSIIQWITLTLAIIITVFQIRNLLKDKEHRLLSIPVLSWIIHIIIFYTTMMFDTDRKLLHYSDWSQAVRLHTVFITGIMLHYHAKRGV